MRHILVLNAKGGSGKTTIATNLASYYAHIGASVALADYDPQESSLAWLEERSSARPVITGIAAHRETVRASRSTDYMIIDSPASVDGKELGVLLRKSETIIIPVLPSPVDMRAAANFVKKIKESKTVSGGKSKIALVANRVRENTNIYHELEGFLKKMRVPVLTNLRDSMNYIRASEKGLGIHELAPYITQVDREQWEPVIKWIKSKRSQP